MNTFEEIKAILRGKDGKKLAVFSLAVFLVIAAIVFFAFFQLSESVHLKLMNEYLDELPKIIGMNGRCTATFTRKILCPALNSA